MRLKADLVHIIWNDGHYDMVKFQEEMKYGRAAGVDFGPVATQGPVIVDIPVDYSDNAELGAAMLPDQIY